MKKNRKSPNVNTLEQFNIQVPNFVTEENSKLIKTTEDTFLQKAIEIGAYVVYSETILFITLNGTSLMGMILNNTLFINSMMDYVLDKEEEKQKNHLLEEMCAIADQTGYSIVIMLFKSLKNYLKSRQKDDILIWLETLGFYKEKEPIIDNGKKTFYLIRMFKPSPESKVKSH